MRCPRLFRLRSWMPTFTATGRANALAGILLISTIGVPWCLSGSQAAGVYRGAVRPGLATVPVGLPSAAGNNAPQGASNFDNKSTAQAGQAPRIEGRLALQMKHALLLQARKALQQAPNYTATFVRQERVSGDLLAAETVDMKVRHAPFSVYMRWVDGEVGQEVLYVDGNHDGKLLVKKGGSVGDLLPTIKLDPKGSLALAKARHPVTEAGLLHLTDLLLKYVERDLGVAKGITCRFLQDTKIENRRCYCIQTEYGSAEIDQDYRCSLSFFDQETGLPLCVQNYGWPAACGASADKAQELSEDTLVEAYTYANVKLEKTPKPEEFQHTNKEYRFIRK